MFLHQELAKRDKMILELNQEIIYHTSTNPQPISFKKNSSNFSANLVVNLKR
jgi:hypothetical protein